MNLETQIQESRNIISKHKCPTFENPSIIETKTNNNDVYQQVKVANLETRTNSIEQNLILLTSKIESMQFNILNTPKTIKIFSCDSCEYETSDKSKHQKHKKEHKSETIYCCKSCDYETIEQINFMKHMDVHKNLQCHKCSYVAIHNRDLNRHDKGMHGEESEVIFSCDKCEFTTQYDETLNKHITDEHSLQTRSRYFYRNNKPINRKTESKIKCNLCNFETFDLEDLRTHKKEHMKEPCSKDSNNDRSESIDMLRTPKFNGRNKDTNPISKCDKCNEEFWHLDEVALHMEYFHGTKQQ